MGRPPPGPERGLVSASSKAGAGRHQDGEQSSIEKELKVRYLLMVCSESSLGLTAEEAIQLQTDVLAWVSEMDSRGVRVVGDRLRPVSDATTIRARNGEILVSDGSFAETNEQIGGFDVLDCTDLDEAIEVVSKHPMAEYGTLEVRPIWPLGDE
jgi:hypothetical protein